MTLQTWRPLHNWSQSDYRVRSWPTSPFEKAAQEECKTLHEYDTLLQDLDLETGQDNLERAAYGALFPHLMKEMIPDTGGRYYFIPLLPVGAPASLAGHFAKVIEPQECSTPEAYRALLDRWCPPTENSREPYTNNRACVLKCGHAVAVMQSRENLFEKQPFTVDLPSWVTGLAARKESGGLRLTWAKDAAVSSYRVWERIPGAKVYPEWKSVKQGLGWTHVTVFARLPGQQRLRN